MSETATNTTETGGQVHPMVMQFLPTTPVQSSFIVMVNGVEKGRVHVSETGRHHSIIDLKSSLTGGIIQGFGRSPVEAVVDAIANGRIEAKRVLSAISDFEHDVFSA
jgi:hypothetical protein